VVTLFASVSPAAASFGIVPDSLKTVAENRDGSLDTAAGSHPYAYTVSFELNHNAEQEAEGSARDVLVDLPPGLVGNAATMPRCPRASFDASERALCPGDTQVGTLAVAFRGPGEVLSPHGAVYNLAPPPGVAASFGFSAGGYTAIENAVVVDSSSGYRIQVTSNDVSTLHLEAVTETIWGVPADHGHDPERECGSELGNTIGCSTDILPTPFLTLPTACGTPLSTLLEADSLEAPGDYLAESAQSLDAGGNPAGLLGCESLDFSPSIALQPETAAAATPTGPAIDLHLPQHEAVEGLAEADLRQATVTLPAGLVVNPSSANGLAGCSLAQIGLGGTQPPACPAASNIATVELRTPLIAHTLPGTVYLASQGDNPFHSLLAIYIVIDDPETGTVVKLAGHVEPNPTTGQLTTTFSENPQFPFEDLKVHFTGGPRAALTTPETCGSYTTTTNLTPWTTPEGANATPSSTFQITSGPGGTPCAYSAAEEPNHPGFEAGTTIMIAGSYSPFLFRISREDGSQPLKQLEFTLPPGLTGKIAGTTQCSPAQVAAAETPGRTGAEERATPSCPASSEVGTVHVTGHEYLSGPYNGAPFSLITITPAVAGPFDLGVVVVHAALYINPQTAQVTVKTDPLPTILDGIPLDIRTITVNANRSQFTRNPTSCEPLSITGNALTTVDQTAPLTDPFQVGACAALPFKPTFTAAAQAHTSKVNGESLTVKVTQQLGEADIHKVDLQLPTTLPSRLSTLQKACSEAQFAANPAGCPEGSIVGSAIAHTPLLASPLTGPAYLVSHGGAAFPDLVYLLQGEGIKLQLTGNTDIKNGITYSRFETVPDQPISSFETTLPEGPHSILTAYGNPCTNPLAMPTTITAHNGLQQTQNTHINVTGCPKPALKVKTTRATPTSLIITYTLTQHTAITITANGIRTTKLTAAAGTHHLTISLTTTGRAARTHRRSIHLHITLQGPNSTTRKTATVKL
jgi:hypothetical protein